jgi:alginate O-acetyltransferase complex protein AlgI
VGTVAFAVQIYCDFSGYTDIAIGSARVMGLQFPGNFAHPYFSKNITEFWQRWHISLSTWLRDYVYFPLGGNRRNKSRRYLSLLLTMAICGLWHGASWNFLLWGIYQGALLVGHRSLFFGTRFFNDSYWNPVKILFTFYLTCVGWLIFIIPDPEKLLFYLKKMLFWDWQSSGLGSIVMQQPKVAGALVIFIAAHLISYWSKDLVQTFAGLRLAPWAVCRVIGVVGLFFLASHTQQSFIYFQF